MIPAITFLTGYILGAMFVAYYWKNIIPPKEVEKHFYKLEKEKKL